MKRLILAALASIAAAPAFAHAGPHLHPHNIETSLGIALACGVLAAYVIVKRVRDR